MKALTLLIVASTVLHLAASLTRADEILVYKTTSARSWNQYSNTQLLENFVNLPRTPLAGKYNATEWWIFNRTTSVWQKIEYYTRLDNGTKYKLYRVSSPEVLGTAEQYAGFGSDETTEMFVKLPRKPLLFSHNIMAGYSFASEESEYDSPQTDQYIYTYSVSGDAEPLVLSPTLSIQKVARKLTGPWNYGSDSSYEVNQPGQGVSRTLLTEQGKTTAVLDLKKTKTVNTATTGLAPYWNPTLIEPATIQFARTLIENELYKLGYNLEPTVE